MNQDRPPGRKPIFGKRKPIRMDRQELVETRPLIEGGGLPLLASPITDGVDLLTWAGTHRRLIEKHLHTHGGILFRGFKPGDITAFERLMELLAADGLLEYTYRSTPRTKVSGHIYTSTEYPPDQSIPLHNENSYSRSWPRKIGFYSIQVAARDGETPIADSREVFARIDPAIKARFMEKKVRYVRNYGALDLPWQTVFQTEDRAEVGRFCRNAAIEFEWRPDGGLRTSQVCQAVARHPLTHDMVWFNQAHLFHVSSLAPHVREALLGVVAEEDLPRNAYYGDGSPIEDGVCEEIRQTYQRLAVQFPWQVEDILILDNMLAAHGRSSFQGTREVVVAMADGFSSSSLDPPPSPPQ